MLGMKRIGIIQYGAFGSADPTYTTADVIDKRREDLQQGKKLDCRYSNVWVESISIFIGLRAAAKHPLSTVISRSRTPTI
jgi:hypothetical protein